MLNRIFKLNERNTTLKREIIAGLSSFAAMAYILILIPKIMADSGLPYGASLTSLALCTFIASLLMAFIGNLPFGIAPYLGECAFVSYTVILLMKYKPSEALGAIFVCGFILLLLTFFGLRQKIVNSIPQPLKYSFTIGLGVFLTYLGFVGMGFVNVEGDCNPFVGNLLRPTTLFAIFGIILTFILTVRKVKWAILAGILSTLTLGIIFGDVQIPSNIFSIPPSIKPLIGVLDIKGVLSLKAFPVIFLLLVIIFADTMGATMALASKANLLDENGNMKDIKKPMYIDSISTIISTLFGSITQGAYPESMAGLDAGGKTGIVPIVIGFLFVVCSFFSPLLQVIPSYAYSVALVCVGMLLVSSFKFINFDDYGEYVPVIFSILVMLLTMNLGVGMAFAFIFYPLVKLFTKERRSLNTVTWILFVMSIIFLVLYPY